MSILFEFIPSLFVALAFDFILYITGVGILFYALLIASIAWLN